MKNLEPLIYSAFEHSRKLRSYHPNAEQLSNIVHRLRQIFTEVELDEMNDRQFFHQVERVWPIAQYVDRQ